jgi:hypothetical protein
VVSAPVLNKIFEYYKRYQNQIEDILIYEIIYFPWFHEQFTIANGLQWLSNMASNHYMNGRIILEYLLDQIAFESASLDLNGPLECGYICLQALQGSEADWNLASIWWNINVDTELSHLWDALIWILENASKMRNAGYLPASEDIPKVPAFAKIGIRKIQKDRFPGRIRSFEFAREMSTEQWEEWSNRVKSMAMGVKLGGLGCGLMYARDRFTRDPDGICGWISSA